MEDLTGLMAIILIFGTPVLLAVIIGWIIAYGNQAKRAERDRARATYERIAIEKLDVIKTAIAMGLSSDELRELDQRLERLIGSDQLRSLLNEDQPAVPVVNQELRDNDLLEEVERQREQRRNRDRD